MSPEIVAITITRETYTIVFSVPTTLRITNMFGNESDGPASSNAKAGPLPIPAASRPCTIGTSVRVAKYMNAPTIDAKKFENTELPPTIHSIHSLGITPAMVFPSWVEPSKKPAVITPKARRGSICLANPQADNVHSLFSSSLLSKSVIILNEAIPTIIGTRGLSLAFSM